MKNLWHNEWSYGKMVYGKDCDVVVRNVVENCGSVVTSETITAGFDILMSSEVGVLII